MIKFLKNLISNKNKKEIEILRLRISTLEDKVAAAFNTEVYKVEDEMNGGVNSEVK